MILPGILSVHYAFTMRLRPVISLGCGMPMTSRIVGEMSARRPFSRVMPFLVTRNAEDKHSPLTDDELVEALSAKGYKVARRTVAKYRALLDIPKARLRHSL